MYCAWNIAPQLLVRALPLTGSWIPRLDLKNEREELVPKLGPAFLTPERVKRCTSGSRMRKREREQMTISRIRIWVRELKRFVGLRGDERWVIDLLDYFTFQVGVWSCFECLKL